jgi:hypothetical protein
MTARSKLTLGILLVVIGLGGALWLGDPLGVSGTGHPGKYYVRPSYLPLPEGKEVDVIKGIVEASWELVHEATLNRARGQETYYKELMRQYYSATRLGPVVTSTPRSEYPASPQPPPEKADKVQPFTFVFADANASALEKQWNRLDYARYNDGPQPALVWQERGVDRIVYQRLTSKAITQR